MTRTGLFAALAAALLVPCFSTVSYAGVTPPPASIELTGGVQWFTRLKDGLAEARRTGKPILYLSAAPSCGGVPGLW